MAYSRQPGHRTILVVDVEGFGSEERQRNPIQEAIRLGVYQVLQWALEAANISWDDCYHEDRGDGVLVLVAPQVSKAPFVRYRRRRRPSHVSGSSVLARSATCQRGSRCIVGRAW